ncbi:MAG: ArsR family transcriptional regulator [Firmicutes bacterium]|nr:ArsR family transcriptional regulator [Bacillota bacterium]
MVDQNTPDVSVNKLIHEQVRLAILTYLASSETQAVQFTELKQNLELTAGNLSVQLRKLEDAGYVQIDKTIEGRKPVTSVALTLSGLDALNVYIAKMEAIIQTLKNAEVKKK